MEKRIIEINGVKMEVDLREATKIDNYKVGDHIKVLIKSYSDSYESHIGTIIGFDNFEKLPTVVIAYLKSSYSVATIEYLYFNDATKDAEITHLNDWDIPVTKDQVIKKFDYEAEESEQKIRDIKNRKELFEKLFGKYFENLSA